MQEQFQAHTTITMRDHLNWFFAGSRCIRTGFITGFAFAIVLLIIEYIFTSELSTKTIATAGVALLFIPAIAIPLTLAIQVIWFLRLTLSQREMTWELDENGIFLKDNAGNGVQLPWSQVKKFSDRKTGFLIDTRPTGSRWIPMRAFKEEDLEGVKRLAERIDIS